MIALPVSAQDAAGLPSAEQDAPFTSDLPELRPLDVVRPALPDAAAAEVAGLDAKIAALDESWLTAATRAEQDAALGTALALAERVLAIRREFQGNRTSLVRWRDAGGEPSEWHEVGDARRKVENLRHTTGLDDEARATLATLVGTDEDVEQLVGKGKYAEAQAVTQKQLDIRRRVLGDEHPDTLSSINSMGILLESQGKLAEAEPYYREALATAERLRTDVIGGERERAAFAGALRLPAIAADYAALLVQTDRAAEALGVAERGRARAALDLVTRDEADLGAALRAAGDVERIARYESASKREQQALLGLREAEARLGAAEDDTTRGELDALVKRRRREMNEATAAVFAELRGLIPAADPLTSEEILAALEPGEALVGYLWSKDRVLALVARDGRVEGVSLAGDKDAALALNKAAEALRAAIATRPDAPGSSVDAAVLDAARDGLMPEALRAKLAGASPVTLLADGPLHSLPVELLLPETPIAYAPSATIAIDRRRAAERHERLAASALVVGDPVFDRTPESAPPEPAYPETGVLVAVVTRDSNAAIGGLQRGDVLLSYGGHALESAQDLGPAIKATAEELTTRGSAEDDRPITAEVWRGGETIEVKLAPGRMGVRPSPAPPADGLRAMAFADRSADEQAAGASALDQVRLYGGSLGPLPGTRREAEAVASMLAGSTLLLGEDATAPHLRDAVFARVPRILHLATHGLTGNADRPYEASLALTRPETPSSGDIGFLTLDELMSRWVNRLDGCALVVLSACDTGRGVARGDSVMALPLGFFAAGAETVVASLWKVDDTATALLMSRFYANAFGKSASARTIDGAQYSPGVPMPKLAALREARAWLRSLTVADRDRLTGASPAEIADAATRGEALPRRGRSTVDARGRDARPYAHPYYWSAFVLYGHGG